MNQLHGIFLAAVAALLLAACASSSSSGGDAYYDASIRTGVIEQLTMTEVKSNHDQGVGAILGGLAGAGIGSLIGAGTGRDVAIAAGAIAGAVGGNIAQQKYFDKPQPAQQLFVRLTSGVLISITQPVNPNLYKGQRVYIEGTGIDARVLPQ
jgi:outer membrane lipoprotein SlyB